MREGLASVNMRVTIGVIHYRTYELLHACLDSVRRQLLRPCEIIVVDNGARAEEAARARAAFPEVRYVVQLRNWGYAAAANHVVAASQPDSDVLLLNPDVQLAENFIEALAHFDADPRAGILGGQLLRPDGRIDSVGIVPWRNGRARDLAPVPSQVSKRPFPVFAVCGAAIYLRRPFIRDIVQAHGECFDPAFFVYHEDVDLAWRARWLGWTCWTVPGAVAQHLRGWQAGKRAEMPVHVRRHAFKNHYLRLAKVVPASMLLRHAPWLVTWEVLRLGYAVLREPDVLPAYGMALRALPEAWRKRRRILGSRRLPASEIRAWLR